MQRERRRERETEITTRQILRILKVTDVKSLKYFASGNYKYMCAMLRQSVPHKNI